MRRVPARRLRGGRPAAGRRRGAGRPAHLRASCRWRGVTAAFDALESGGDGHEGPHRLRDGGADEPVRSDRPPGRRHRLPARHRPGHGRGAGRRRRRHHRRQRARWSRTGSEVGAAGRRHSAGPSRAPRRPRRPRGRHGPRRATLADSARPVDILVNNAGTIRRAPAAEHADDDWDHVLEVNLTAPVRPGPRGRPARCCERRPRKDHLHRVAAELPGRHQRARLRRGEVRHRRADQGAGQRVGRHAASTSTRSRPATSPPTTPRRCATTPTATGAILDRIPAGRWGRAGGPRRRDGLPRLARRRTTSTAPCCPSTAAGCRGESGCVGRPRTSCDGRRHLMARTASSTPRICAADRSLAVAAQILRKRGPDQERALPTLLALVAADPCLPIIGIERSRCRPMPYLVACRR